MNLIYLIMEILLVYTSLLVITKKNKQEGIYLFSIIAIILSNIMVIKTTEILTLEIAHGFTLYSSIFIANNIIVQRHGPEESKKLIYSLLVSSIISYLIIYLSSYLTIGQTSSITYDIAIKNSLRNVLANTISIISTLWFSSILYHQIRKSKNKIIISNTLSTIIISFASSIIFCLIAYTFKIEAKEIAMLIFIRYIIITIIELLGVIPIYIITKRK